MNPETVLLPHLAWVLTTQGPVIWIYVAQMLCLATRFWVSLRLFGLPCSDRPAFMQRTATLADTTGNAALLLGVIGTLIGVAVAVMGRDGSVDPAALMATFSNAFSISVTTTVAGGLTYIACLLLGSLEESLVG